MEHTSPTARALLCLEALQGHPGISAEHLGRRLGVSDRAARRYVAILREAGVPVVSERGRYGGYRLGRGHRVPPLMFTNAEALALVMAVLEGDHAAGDPATAVGGALAKIVRVLPAPVAAPVDAIRRIGAAPRAHESATPDPTLTARLVEASGSAHRVRLDYRTASGSERVLEVDPWAVVTRHGRWYLLCWSHASDARRVLRVDRVAALEVLPATFTPPAHLDPVEAVEDHLSDGWSLRVEVVIDAPAERIRPCLPRSLGRVEPLEDGRCRLTGSTDEPHWYAHQLSALPAAYEILGPPEVRQAAREIARTLLAAAGGSAG